MNKYWWVAAVLLILVALNLAAILIVPRFASAPQGEANAVTIPALTDQEGNGRFARGSGDIPRGDRKVSAGGGDDAPSPTRQVFSAGPSTITVDAGNAPVVVHGGRGMISPEQRAELEELRRNNPQAYAERFRQIAEEARERRMAEANALKELVENYRATGSEIAREELLARLETDFDRQSQQIRDQIKRLEEHLERRLAEKDKQLEQTIEKYLAR